MITIINIIFFSLNQRTSFLNFIFIAYFSQETKTNEEKIEHKNNDQDTCVEDTHIENNSDKENAPSTANETKESPDIALSANEIKKDNEPVAKKTPPVSGLLGKLINISKAQKAPAANSEKTKADLNTFQRRIGSLVRLQAVNISEDDKNIENTKDTIETKYTTKSKVKKQIRPRSLDGTSDENQRSNIARPRLSSSSDNERNTETKAKIQTNTSPMQVSGTKESSENMLIERLPPGSKAGTTLPVSGPVESRTIERLRSESSSHSDSGILILNAWVSKTFPLFLY